MIFSDQSLSQKLERTEARANADFVETRAALDPSVGATWIEVAGAYAMFDGPESPCTQTFGLGLFDEVTGDHLDELERFFVERGAPVFHEVSPMGDPALLQLLGSRGYQPVELSTMMYRELTLEATPLGGGLKPGLKTDVKTRVINKDEAELWARTSAEGWSTEMEGLAEFMLGFGRISASCKGAYPFLAELNGKAISTGMLLIYDDACVLAGASTIPEGRNQGAQGALLAHRLSFAAARGCKLAIMGAAPGSQSQKNAQKNGFQIAYTRTKWHLPI
ncbi:MAG TPA: hypothetical protein VFZ23_17535 [Pyrinomonadaceae bacterium]